MGGNGFIGRHCVGKLLAAGHSVRVLARDGKGQDGVEAAGGDITQPETLPAAIEGVEAVVHSVGLIVEPRGVSFESVVRDGTRNLVNASKVAGIGHITYISAIGTRPNAPSRYHQTKWQAEEAIRASGIGFTIFRSSTVFGPEDDFINKFLRMPFIPLPGGGKGMYQPIYVNDLANVAARSVENPGAANQTFDACGPERMTYREMLQTALEVSGKRKPMISLPMWMMGMMATLGDPLQKIWLPLAPITKDQYTMLQEPNTGDNGPLLQAFPDLNLTTLREGLSNYVYRAR